MVVVVVVVFFFMLLSLLSVLLLLLSLVVLLLLLLLLLLVAFVVVPMVIRASLLAIVLLKKKKCPRGARTNPAAVVHPSAHIVAAAGVCCAQICWRRDVSRRALIGVFFESVCNGLLSVSDIASPIARSVAHPPSVETTIPFVWCACFVGLLACLRFRLGDEATAAPEC